jgi:hypothetical protein
MRAQDTPVEPKTGGQSPLEGDAQTQDQRGQLQLWIKLRPSLQKSRTQLKQAVIDRARRVIVAIDSSKFGRTDFVMICRLDRTDMIITDEATSDVATWCAANQITLKVAEP